GLSKTNLLKQYNKIKAKNVELKAKVAKLKNKQLQNKLIKIYYLY
ncbi:39119_t:CDS:1, partial [Gigaspora margarita]